MDGRRWRKIKKYFPARPKGLPKGYDSWPEYELHNGLLKGHEHHPEWINYTVDRKYQPDFIIEHKGGEILVEFKGYFRDAPELSKYVWIRKALEDHQELIFIYDNINKPIHFKPMRKCGTKMTCGEWSRKNEFRYFNQETFEEFYATLEI